MTCPDLGQSIRRHRIAVGMSQSALGAKIGRSRNTIANWERGVGQPTTAKLLAIANAVGCTLTDIMENREPPKFHYHGGAYPA